MKFKTVVFVALALSGVMGWADVLELKNGRVLNGKYMGGSAGTVRFDAGGELQVLETAQIVALTFTTTPAVSQAPAPAPAPASKGKLATIPLGTPFMVRMMDSVSSQNGPGTTFTTRLEYGLLVDGMVAIPAGTIIYGKVQGSTEAGRALGKSSLDLRLTEVILGGNTLPMATSSFKEGGASSTRKTARHAGMGAMIGGAVNGGDGAGKGAAIGAMTGLVRKGETVTVTPGTLLEFRLAAPLSVRVD
ncbi:MAG: hypothetical protein PHV34_19305 [Verrucomicrobiae bacterium]|nr:hypothetical protein [Verrucomicrobiae bacterium]